MYPLKSYKSLCPDITDQFTRNRDKSLGCTLTAPVAN